MRPADTSIPGWGGLLFLAVLCTGTALIHITSAGILLVGFLFGILWLHVVRTNNRFGKLLCSGVFVSIAVVLLWSLFEDRRLLLAYYLHISRTGPHLFGAWKLFIGLFDVLQFEDATGQKLGLFLILMSSFWLMSIHQQTTWLRITFLTFFVSCLWMLLPLPMIAGVVLVVILLELSVHMDQRRAVRYVRNTTQRLFASIILGAGVIILAGSSVELLGWGVGSYPECCDIDQYELTLQVTDHTAGQFRVHETAQLGQFSTITETRQLTFPPYTVESTPLGIFLREVHVHPLKVNEDGTGTSTSVITTTDGFVLDGPMLFRSDAKVTIYDLPRNAFFAVRDVVENTTSYVYTETASWEGVDPLRGVTFAYLAPPFHRVRFLLEPFLRIAAAISSYGYSASWALPCFYPWAQLYVIGWLRD